MEAVDGFVNVAVRIRPSWENQQNSFNNCLKVINSDPPVIYLVDRQQSYSFDNVFTEESDQELLYSEVVEPLIDKVVAGYNCTVFAYGQTGTGKTYTIGSDSNNNNETEEGLIIRTFNSLLCKSDENREIEVYVSFLEIYNEKVYDLLNKEKVALQVKGFNVVNLTKTKISDITQVRQILLNGGKSRHTGKTKQNPKSSRSHAIFTIYCTVRDENDEIEAKLNLVDLAGSESVKKSGNEGSQFHEGVNINKGLLFIGQVIKALSSNDVNIPYRQSTITKILQDSLNKRNYVTLVACISPNVDDLNETIQTLDFAQRTKRIRNKPEINTIVAQYTKDNPSVPETIITKSMKKVRPCTNIINSSRKYRTPLKILGSVFHTSTEVRRPNPFNSTLLNCERSVPSLNLSSVSTIYDAPQNISPIVKKYINALEASLMEKFEGLLKESLPRRSPRLSLNSLHTTVSQLVQKEQKYHKFHQSNPRAHSSPVLDEKENEDVEVGSPRKKRKIATKLSFNKESPLAHTPPVLQDIALNTTESPPGVGNLDITLDHIDNSIENDDKSNRWVKVETVKRKIALHFGIWARSKSSLWLSFAQLSNQRNRSPMFKVPVGIPKRNKRGQEHHSPKLIVPSRHSSRLSLKRKAISPSSTCDLEIVNLSRIQNDDLGKLNTQMRRSTRLSLKQAAASPKPLPRKLAANSSCNRSQIKPVPAARKKERGDKSVHFLHSEHILNILNNGNAKDLQTIYTIGDKTAGQIILYRQLKGKFHDVSDMQNILSKGLYSRFMKSNFLNANSE